MLAPERRTRGDLAIAALIVVLVAVTATVIWWHSDARGTTSIAADSPVAEPPAAASVPTALHELWRAPNTAATVPLTAAGAVVTGDGGTVIGHDRLTGAELWRYQRDMPLCAVSTEWGKTVAVYRDRRGCSQVTTLRGSDGARDAHRSSDADDTLALSSDGTHMLALGTTRLEVWRWDLVRTVEYGRVDAPVSSGTQPRSGCTFESAVAGKNKLAVLERCPGDTSDRLTIQNPSPKDAQEPEESGSTVLLELTSDLPGTRVLAVSGDKTAVYLPGDGNTLQPRIGVFDGSANPVAQYPISSPLLPDAAVGEVQNDITVWTGTQLILLDSRNLDPKWTFDGALGPGAEMVRSLLVPVADGIAVLDPRTGTEQSRIPLQRNASTDGRAITTAVLGDTVLEQRGNEVVALGP